MSANHKPEKYELSMLYRIRHSTAHVMAEAVLQLFPDARIAIGPAIEDGFYYDFDLPRALTPEDLAVIEARMRTILSSGATFIKKVVTAGEARELFRDQPYKLELIDGLEQVSSMSTAILRANRSSSRFMSWMALSIFAADRMLKI